MKDHSACFLPLFVLMLVASVLSPGAHAQTLTTLYSFCDRAGCPNGNEPSGALAQALDGDLYGTTLGGGAYSGLAVGGTAFKISPGGTFTLLYSFCAQSECTDGSIPNGGLALTGNGDLYGTTQAYGEGAPQALQAGTVFKIASNGTLATIFSFCAQPGCPNGVLPSNLLLADNDELYGTIAGGNYAAGAVFEITPSGTLTTVYNPCTQSGEPVCAIGGSFQNAGLLQAPDGALYGTFSSGGTDSVGTVFKMTPGGALTVLYDFSQADHDVSGIAPEGPLVMASNGDLYGTTSAGGTQNGGTIFKLTPSGTLTTLHDFPSLSDGGPDGSYPFIYLQATDGNLYGIARESGTYGGGTVFKITPAGTFTTLYSFCAKKACADGETPSGLMQATDGNLYGTTVYGGIDAAISGAAIGGTVFRLSMGLAPFVKTLSTLGRAGAAVTILGTDLSGASAVTFNGTPATFRVLSVSAIRATVPAGATTGRVQVTTPSGTLSSNTAFRVTH